MDNKLPENNNVVAEKNNNSRIIIALLVILLVGALGFICYDKFINKEKPPVPTSTSAYTDSETSTPTTKPVTKTSTFKYISDNYGLASYGYAYVKGYAVISNNIVSFHMTNTDSDDFKKAVSEWGFENNNIPIGCLKDGVISYSTAADEFGPSDYNGSDEEAYEYFSKTLSLSNDVTSKIIESNANNEITLKLGKTKLTRYMNLYEECRTEITNIELED